ncbi:hypothetical protein, partial [Streptomyces tendae]
EHVVHYDRWWNPAVEAQATDRAYRIGQTRPVPRAEVPAAASVPPSSSRSGPVETVRHVWMLRSARCRVDASRVVRTAMPARPSASASSRSRP